jgi:hypothetical protein
LPWSKQLGRFATQRCRDSSRLFSRSVLTNSAKSGGASTAGNRRGSAEICSFAYALPVHSEILPLFSKESSHSVLTGDYASSGNQELLFQMLVDNLVSANETVYHHGSQYFMVYINNLTDQMIRSFHEGLSHVPFYAGYVDTTLSSPLKTCLSLRLVQTYIKHRKIIIVRHEPDVSDDKDVNTLGYPFEESGFTVRGMRDYLGSALLTYKIERPVVRGFDPEPLTLTELEVREDAPMFDNLSHEKRESLSRIGLLGGGRSKLKAMIAERIASSHIYNLSYDSEYDTTYFNVVLEVIDHNGFAPFRLLVGLRSRDNCLSVIKLW